MYILSVTTFRCPFVTFSIPSSGMRLLVCCGIRMQKYVYLLPFSSTSATCLQKVTDMSNLVKAYQGLKFKWRAYHPKSPILQRFP